MYSKGQPTSATVERILPFGVFVRLEDGARAYIRRRELSLAGDLDPRDLVSEGQHIEAVVSAMAGPDSLMELSVRDALPDPWLEFVRQIHQGDIVTATVKSLLPDKVFVQIVPGVNGLIPLEELATWQVAKPEDVVWTGDQVEAVVTHLDVAGKRVRLSIRRRLEQLNQAEAVVEYLRQKDQPVATPEAQGAAMAAPEADRPAEIGLAEPILVVEDHDQVRTPLVKWLCDQKCTAHGAATAAEALTLCKAQQYGLLIVDLGLPDMDGLDLVRKLREANISTPVAAMSGPEIIAEQLPSLHTSGVIAVLAKPLDLEEIRHLLLRLANGEKPALFETDAHAPPTEARAFQRLSGVMRSSQPLAERFRRGLDQLVRETRAEVGVVFHLDPTLQKISLVASSGDMALNKQALYSLLDSPVKDVIREGRTLLEGRASSERTGRYRKLLALLPFESCIGVPLEASSQTEHALFLFHREPEIFTRYRLRDALAMAALFAVALESQILQERVESLSRIFLSGQLAAGFGHEVYNRLSGLDLRFHNVRSDFQRLTETALELSARPDFQAVQRDLDKALETAADLKRVVEEFQRLVRAEEEKSVEVNQVVRLTEAQVRPLAARAKVKIRLELAAELLLAMGSSIRLQQVFLNLMLNAIQQMSNKPDGRRVLTVATSCTREDDGAWTVIRFSDSGPGIHRQLWDKIFALGFTTRTDGSGLGLYIVRSLVESMGGQIEVEKSLVPLGTTFIVRLRTTREARRRE